jgi:hypothetical protein
MRAPVLSHGSRSCLPVRKCSGAVTCPAALDLVSMLGRALALSRVPWLQILPPYSGGIRRCHVSHGIEPCLPAQEGYSDVTCPTALCGPQTSRIKKCLADLPLQLGSSVSKTCSHVTKTSDTWVIMARKTCGQTVTVQCRPSWSLLDMTIVVIQPDMATPRHWPCLVQQDNSTLLTSHKTSFTTHSH